MSIFKKWINFVTPERLRWLITLLKEQRTQSQKAMRTAKKNQQKIDELLKSPIPIKLELGAGENRGLAGWTYADVNENCDLTLDLTQPLPLPSNSVEEIYSSHLLEHFDYNSLSSFLAECLRIMKPGGIFSAAIPNARVYIEAYLSPEHFDPDIFCRYKPAFQNNSKIDFVNYIAYMAGQHRYMFDEENAISILSKSGFSNVKLRGFDEELDMVVRDSQSLYVSAEK